MVRFSPEHSHHHHHTPWDRFDARARVLVALVLCLGAALSDSIPALLAGLVLAIIIAATSGMALRTTVIKVLGLDLFILAAVATLPFTIAGEVAFSIWGLSASWAGLERALGILIKATTVMLLVLSLVGQLEIPALGRALYKLKVPDGLVHLLLFTVRYASVLSEEFTRLRITLKARNFRAGVNAHSYRTLGFLVGMVFVRGLERSERILDAMKCRGFHGHFHVMEDQSWAGRDSLLLAVSLFTAMGLAIIGGVLG